MTVESFKSEIRKLEMGKNYIIAVVEGPGIGLIGLNSSSEFIPCQIIAEDKHDYYFIDSTGNNGSCPKRSFQIVTALHQGFDKVDSLQQNRWS